MKSYQNKSDAIKITIMLFILAAAMLFAAEFGAAQVKLSDIVKVVFGREIASNTETILFKVRLPRIITGVLVGGLLSVCGCLMQAILKNRMADPSVMGISGGAALGATFVIVTGLDYSLSFIGFSGRFVGAVLGASITFVFIMTVAFTAGKRGQSSTSSTLLAGIAVSSFTSAMITVLMALNKEDMERAYMWMLGSLSSSSVSKSLLLVVMTIIFIPIILFIAPQIDILKLGSTTASTYGINSNRLMCIVLTISSILIAVCVADCGIIGFVGLIVPHIVSFAGIKRMRTKILMCLICGGLLVLIADTIARTIIAPSELPVGAITSLIGAPYFIVQLLRSREVRK